MFVIIGNITNYIAVSVGGHALLLFLRLNWPFLVERLQFSFSSLKIITFSLVEQSAQQPAKKSNTNRVFGLSHKPYEVFHLFYS